MKTIAEPAACAAGEETMKQTKEYAGTKAAVWIVIGVAVLLFFDRLTKYLAVVFLKGTEGITLIEKGLRLQYLENHGAAFGILQNKQFVFWILTAVFIALAIWFFRKVPKTRYYLPVIICVVVLLSGAIGNFIDRLMYRYVVDFIYFEIIDFPIFNVADIYVTLSVIALLILVIFHYKEGDFAFLKKKGKKEDADRKDLPDGSEDGGGQQD